MDGTNSILTPLIRTVICVVMNTCVLTGWLVRLTCTSLGKVEEELLLSYCLAPHLFLSEFSMAASDSLPIISSISFLTECF
jgi:hypothetical protein